MAFLFPMSAVHALFISLGFGVAILWAFGCVKRNKTAKSLAPRPDADFLGMLFRCPLFCQAGILALTQYRFSASGFRQLRRR